MTDRLPPGWKITPLPVERIAEYEKYVREIAAEVAAIPRIKREVPTHFEGKLIKDLDAGDRERFYFSQQPKSTQDAMERQKTRKPEDDIDYLLRPMPDGYLANPEATTLEALTGTRSLGVDELILVEGTRRASKNTIGQSTKSSVTPETRERGIHAFTYSKPAEISDSDIKRIKKLNQFEAVVAATSIKEEPKPLSWFQRFKLRFFGKPHTWNAIEERKKLGIE